LRKQSPNPRLVAKAVGSGKDVEMNRENVAAAEMPSSRPRVRSVVWTGASLLLCAFVTSLPAGCECDPASGQTCGAPPLGDVVYFVISTRGDDVDPDGYTLHVGDLIMPAAVQETIELDLVFGVPYATALSGVAHNCLPNSFNVSTVQVDATDSITVWRGTVPDYLFMSHTVRLFVDCSAHPAYVTTITTGQELDADGYRLVVDEGPGGPPNVYPIGINDSRTLLDVGPGLLTLLLEHVATNCIVSAPNPRQALLLLHDSINTTFEVVCHPTVGSLTVTTVTTGSDLDANGYTVALDGLVTRPMGLNASETFNGVAVGTHTVTLGDVAPNCTVVTGAQRTVTLPFGGSASVAYAIVCNAVVPFRVYADDFSPGGNWAVTVRDAMGGTGHSERSEAAGGNPDGYRWMKNDHSDPSRIAVMHLFDSGYDPAIEGPVSHIDYREDNILFDRGTAGTVTGALIVVQAGTVYSADIGTISAATWNQVSRSDLTPADFTPAGLDFSAAGAPLQFGYLRTSVTQDQYGGDMRHGIDNWTVIVHKKLN
jgi:hypothetical protein